MSDENGDAPVPADEPGGEGLPAPTGPALSDPALGSRLDTMHRTLSTLGMRIDALVTSTTTYRTALTDRLTEYTDLVTKLTRTQAADLEEYRRANERTISDLRRGLAGSEEVLERVGARIDSLLTDGESSDDHTRRVLAEVRSILDAQENLGRFLTESLDQFGDRVMERITNTQSETAQQIDAIRTLLADGGDHDGALRDALAPLQQRVETIDQRLADPGRDQALADRIAGLDARIAALAETDAGAAIAGHVDTLHAAIALLATADQVGSLAADVRAQLIDVVGTSGDTSVVDHLTRIERELTSGNQVAAESWGEFAGLRAKVDAILETSAQESGAVAGLLDEVRETLLDVASGEVLGALWDEFRGARSSIDEVLGAVQRAEEAARTAAEGAAAPTADAEPDERFEALRADVSSLTEAVRDLLEQAEVVDETAEAQPDGTLVAIAADVSTLRRELSQGLVVEPSDALSGAVDQLRADVAGLDDRLQTISELQQSVAGLDSRFDSIADVQRTLDELRGAVDQTAARPPADELAEVELRSVRDDLAGFAERMDAITDLQQAVTSLRDEVRAAAAAQPAQPAAPVLGDELEGEIATLRSGVDGLGGDVRTVRSGVEDIIARLDEGLVLADDVAPPAAGTPEVNDQLAVLRDELTSEFDALRRLVSAETSTERPETPEAPEVDLSAVTDRLDAIASRLDDQADVLVDALRAAAERPAAEDGEPGPATDLRAVTELLEHVRDDIAELPDRIEVPAAASSPAAAAPADDDAYATIDPDVVDLLREEIRAAGAVPDDLLEQLRKELIALRRRIRLRAEGELLSDEQLELIADAVARRLDQ